MLSGGRIRQNGVDLGASYRALNTARQQKEDERRKAQEARREAQDRAERPQRATVPGKPVPPLRGRRGPTAARVHPDGLARLLEALR